MMDHPRTWRIRGDQIILPNDFSHFGKGFPHGPDPDPGTKPMRTSTSNDWSWPMTMENVFSELLKGGWTKNE